jgi:hypothetical protein
MRIRSPRGRCLRIPSGTEVSSGKWASLGAVGSPGLSWSISEETAARIGGRCTIISLLLLLLRVLLLRAPLHPPIFRSQMRRCLV